MLRTDQYYPYYPYQVVIDGVEGINQTPHLNQAYVWLHSSRDASSATRIWQIPQFTVLYVTGSAIFDGTYQWFPLSANDGNSLHTGWAPLLDANTGAPVPQGTTDTTLNFTCIQLSAGAPWIPSATPPSGYIYLPPSDFTYTINNAQITITGYTGTGGAVTIPSAIDGLPVTSIGSEAFDFCTSITSITIPNSVTTIGDWAFGLCFNLTSVNIPKSVSMIGEAAFSGCPLPAINADMGNSFYTSVGGVLFNASLTTLVAYPGGRAGGYTIPSSVTSIGGGAFANSRLAGVTIPSSVVSIGEYAFYCCQQLTSVTIPPSVTSIGDTAFDTCQYLTSVSIPNSVTSIGNSVFFGCISLTGVWIPASVSSIGWGAFADCTSMTSITVSPSNPAFTALGGVLFSKDQTVLVAYPAGGAATYSIPEGVVSLGFTAFEYCTRLTSVAIPRSLANINWKAFFGCSSLVHVTMPNPNGAKTAGGLSNIGQEAFVDCTSLTNITIPSTVTNMGNAAFAGCASLAELDFSGDAPNPGSSLFDGDNSAIVYYLPETAGWGAEFGGRPTVPLHFTYVTDSGKITITVYTGPGGSVIIPSAINDCPVTKIGDFAFLACANLTRVTIPNNVTCIGNYTFQYCSNLTTVTIFSGVTSIGVDAFCLCTSLADVTIPSSVTSIGDEAFAFCTSLPGVTIPNGVTSLGVNAFTHCTSLPRVTIPGSVTNIGALAFSYCSNLASVTIDGGVTNIGYMAFYDCPSLSRVFFKGDAPGVGFDVFTGDDKATIFYLPGTTGWGTTFDGLPTVLWNQQVEATDASFGLRANQFGFNIRGTSNIVVLVEASTNLATPTWSPLATNTLTSGSSYFSDPQWTKYPSRFYRLRWP